MRALAALTSAALLSCAEPLEAPPQDIPPGTLEITVVTQGPEPDPDGYLITVDAASTRWASKSGEVFRSTVPAGSHVVQVTDLAPHCSFYGDNPRKVMVQAGTTATVSFVVTCHATGVIQLQVTTTGEEMDADGYLLTLDGRQVLVILGVNSRHEFKGLTKGSHTLELGGIAANCRAKEGSSAQVKITDRPATIAFTVECFAAATPESAFRQISTGELHTCGVTADNRAFCWGSNWLGELGDGTSLDRTSPVAVHGGHQFRSVSAGQLYTCGVTTDNLAYCWGGNYVGQLGDGTTTHRLEPVLVAGGHRFAQVEVGLYHTCGVSHPEKRVYCWGNNFSGQLGDGTATWRKTPVAVASERRFRHVAVGGTHTCGLTPDNQALCWGDNDQGQVGADNTARRLLLPTLVAGGYSFRQIDAGGGHTCAVTTGNRAFCWGYGADGQIGDGKTLQRFSPRAVAGKHSFSSVTTGTLHTCAESTDNRAYCWGGGRYFELGSGTTIGSLTPVPVSGGLFFVQLSADTHTCGVTAAGAGYCWGYNGHGQLGDGTTALRLVPVRVASP